MYTETLPPTAPQFCWGNSLSYFSWTASSHKFSCTSLETFYPSISKTNLEKYESTVIKIGQAYLKLSEEIENEEVDYTMKRAEERSEEEKYEEAVEKGVQNFKSYVWKKKDKLREHIIEIKQVIQENFANQSQFSEATRVYQILLNFIQEMHTSSSSCYYQPPTIKTLSNWIKGSAWKLKKPPKPIKPFLQIVKTCNFNFLMKHVQTLILNASGSSQKQIRFYIDAFQLLKQRMFLYQNIDTFTREKITSLRQSQEISALGKYKLYRIKFKDSDILRIFYLMSGNIILLEKIAGDDWKTFVLLYAMFYDPGAKPWQLFSAVKQFSVKKKLKLSFYDKLEQLLLLEDFGQAYNFAKQSRFISPPIVSVIGLIAFQLNLFKGSGVHKRLCKQSEQQIMRDLTEWMSSPATKWDVKVPYIKKYINVFEDDGDKGYVDAVIRIIKSNEHYPCIKTGNDFLQVVAWCRKIEELELPHYNYTRNYLQNLVRHQLMFNDTFFYTFELLEMYELRKGGQALLKQVHQTLMKRIEDKTVDYKQIVKIIMSIPKQKKIQKRVIDLFYTVGVLYEANESREFEHSKSIMQYVMKKRMERSVFGVLVDVLEGMLRKYKSQEMRVLVDQIKQKINQIEPDSQILKEKQYQFERLKTLLGIA